MKKIFLLGLLASAILQQAQASNASAISGLLPRGYTTVLDNQSVDASKQPTSKIGIVNQALMSNGVLDFGAAFIPGNATTNDIQDTVFIGGVSSSNGYVRAFNPITGVTKWTVTASTSSSVYSVLYVNGVLYVLGLNSVSSQLYIEARNPETGDLITNYFTNGTKTLNDASFSAASLLAYADGSLFILATDLTDSFLYKLNATTGALDSTFGSGTYITLSGETNVRGLIYADGFIYTLSNDGTDSTLTKRSALTGATAVTGTISGAISANVSISSLQVYKDKVWVMTVATRTTTLRSFTLTDFSSAATTLTVSTSMVGVGILPYQNTLLLSGVNSSNQSTITSYLIDSNALDTNFGSNGFYTYTFGGGFPTFVILESLKSIACCTVITSSSYGAVVYVMPVDNTIGSLLVNAQNQGTLTGTGLA